MGFYISVFLFLIFLISCIIESIFFIKEAILSAFSNIKCRKVKGCLKGDCPFRSHCEHTAFTEEEKRIFLDKIESL